MYERGKSPSAIRDKDQKLLRKRQIETGKARERVIRGVRERARARERERERERERASERERATESEREQERARERAHARERERIAQGPGITSAHTLARPECIALADKRVQGLGFRVQSLELRKRQRKSLVRPCVSTPCG